MEQIGELLQTCGQTLNNTEPTGVDT